LIRQVFVEKHVFDSILSYAQSHHPREAILLLRGKARDDKIIVNDLVIPPFANHGEGFSSFPLDGLPLDLSLIGVIHSHPSGNLEPSIQDLNHFYGRIMVIAAYPYQSERDMAAFDREGNLVDIEILGDRTRG